MQILRLIAIGTSGDMNTPPNKVILSQMLHIRDCIWSLTFIIIISFKSQGMSRVTCPGSST